MKKSTLTGHQFLDAVLERLQATEVPKSEQRTALAVLGLIIRWLGWYTYACEKNASELAAMLQMNTADMARTLRLLERVGAITRVKRGQMKIITITPEGAYRGVVDKYPSAVKRYRAEVVPLHQPEPAA